MSLTPADLQNLLSKTVEVGRTQEIQGRRGETDQAQAALRFSQQIELQTKKVDDLPKAHPGRIDRRRDEAGGGGRRGAARRKPPPDGEKEAASAAAPGDAQAQTPGAVGQIVDVRV